MQSHGAQFLPAIEEIARTAGDVLMGHFRKLPGYEKKGAIDLLTIADKDSEKSVVGELLSRFPDHAILAEEGGRLGHTESDYLWIIDPLDGTTNFAHGLRIFAVSIGLTYKGEMLAGCVHAPALEECYTACAGGGAYRNGNKISVSATDQLNDALVVTGFPYDRRRHAELLSEMFREVLRRTQGVVRFGAASWDFACVASGHLDAFYEWGLQPWDMAAGALLVREAGGQLSGLVAGEPFDLFTPRTIASNSRIHAELQEVLKDGGVEGVPGRRLQEAR